ncbi:MAG TPA: hypothetical protein DCL76_06190 [Chloroflexi bacterium]|nr:hypothetical protein [Chloroflexota bacterium]|tara:strand:- start:687 stop:1076 length:390 start_codon:yes stop_codon:yes gene_type:complete
MSKHFFIKLVTSPDVDQFKCIVGLGCTAQAINDGHKVDVFFAAGAVQLLHAEYISALDKTMEDSTKICQGFLKTIINGANSIHCSTASQGYFGVSQDSPNSLIKGIDLIWSGPDGVIALASDAEVILTY